MRLRTILIFAIGCILNVDVSVLADVLICSKPVPNCDCIDANKDETYYSCKDDKNNAVDLYWIPSREIKIHCEDNTTLKQWYELLNKVNVSGEYGQVTIRKCPIPEKPIKEIFDQLSIGRVKTLTIDYTNEPKGTFEQKHFENLDFVETFDFRNNKVRSLSENVFAGLSNVTRLFLNRNYLQSIPVNFFKPVPKVIFLDLAENNLTQLEADTFKYLSKLRTLNLNGNRLTNLTREVFTPLRNLIRLDLNSNGITTLREDVFQDLSKLQDLNLNFNNISVLPESVFTSMKSLKKLRAVQSYNKKQANIPSGLFSNLESLIQLTIERNNLTYLPEDIFRGTVKLVSVSLKMNRFTRLPGALFQFSTNLEMIDISNNKLSTLNETLFRGLRKLTELHIEKNELIFINGNIFDDLNSLEKLYLETNRLAILQDDLFNHLTNLKIISLSNNLLDMKMSDNGGYSPLKDCRKLEELHLRNNSVDTIFNDWQLILTNLRLLDLSHNKLEILKLDDFQFVQSNVHSIELILDDNEINLVDLTNFEHWVEKILCDKTPCRYDTRDLKLSLKNNPINCDCRSYAFIRLIQGKMSSTASNYVDIQSKDELKCTEPSNMVNTALTNVDLMHLYCTTNCPKSCSCRIRAVDKVFEVNCTNVDKLPAWLPNDTMDAGIELSLSHNKLENLKEISPLMTYNVTKLSLSSNALKSIDDLSFPRTLKVLELDHNQINFLSKKSIEQLNRTKVSVTLYNNPWKCDCTAKYLLNFIKHRISESLIPQVNNITCEDTGQAIIHLSVDDLCSNSLYLYIICLSLATFGILFGALTILYLQYEHEIKVFMFAHKICLWLVTEKEVDRDKEYDAFISYSHHDEEFVVKHLIPRLENGPYPYKLCLHYRNWIVGDLIPEQIVRSVGSSRRTIIVLSRNYMESKWANLEFRTAYLQALKERRARVIVILLEDLNPNDKLDPELKAYITMNTYLKWGDTLFWEKLRYALPHPQQYIKLKSTKKKANIIDGKNHKKLMETSNLKEDKSEKKSTDVFIC